MNPINVVIQNWPAPAPWVIAWAPIFVAVCALVVSIASLYWSRKQNRESSRPFLWLMNFGSIQNGLVVNHPEVVAQKITNAPALVTKVEYKLLMSSGATDKEIQSHVETNFVRFPDPSIQSTFSFTDFPKIVQQCKPGDVLKRELTIEYSALSKGDSYFFRSTSIYDFKENVWRVSSESAN